MKRIGILLLVLTLFVSGCGVSGDAAQYIERPAASHSMPLLAGAQASYLGFSTELLQKATSSAEENPLLSPASVYFALSMMANGAEEETKAAFEKVLGLPIHQLNEVSLALMNNLSMTQGSTILNIANSVWVDNEEYFTVAEEFVSLLQESYYAEYTETDLQTAQKAVNAWVKHHTNGMIPAILSEQPYDDTRLMLINTIYLKTGWEEQFDPNATHKADFTLENGETVSAEFLSKGIGPQQCILTDTVSGVMLPYDDGNLAFLALMPKEGTVRELVSLWEADSMTELLSSAEEKTAWITMPKFTKEYSAELLDALTEMGLGIAFDMDAADFSGIAPNIYISRVLQKTRIDVHEKGTEAAAATIVEAGDGAMFVEELVELDFNVPYLYAVVDLESGLPLFLGIMDDPT